MKSAFELALERSGGKLTEIPEDIKQKLNDVEVKCRAKIAELELAAQQSLASAQEPEKINEIKEWLQSESLAAREKAEREKKALREKNE